MEQYKSNIINASFSIYSAPGTFALLLGSGISQGAGIPTGWDITQDLIKQIALLQDEKDIEDPELWFRTKYGIPPSYSDLLEKWGKSPVERGRILKKYIEPNDEEREEGKKIPSAAHKAIAWLVKSGYIRVIVTTNFDRLLESALQEKGINPVVIFNEHLLEGSLPFQHNECTIIKLHGDYLDTRIKNTSEELASYSEDFNKLLDRIFDEYGIIICGWSAQWDIALKESLQRRINRRFAIYWAYRGILNDGAKEMCLHLQSIPIQIESADQFFIDLSEKVNALIDFNQPHPLSIPLAIAQVKKYVVSDKYRVKLHDLIQDEVRTLCENLQSDRFNPQKYDSKNFNVVFHSRMHNYEQMSDMLVNIFSNLVYFDNGKYSHLISPNLESIYQKPFNNGNSILLNLQAYPALLIAYAIGIASVESNNYKALGNLFLNSKFDDLNRTKSMPEALNVWRVFTHESHKIVPIDDANHLFRPASEYLNIYLKSVFNHLISNEKRFETIFNTFEFLLGLVYIDLEYEDLSKMDWAPLGKFQPNYYSPLSRVSGEPPFVPSFIKNIQKERRGELGMLSEGFFQGSINRLEECLDIYEKWLTETAKNMF